MPRTPGSKKLTPEKKAAGALFLVDLATRGTRAVDAVKKAMTTFKLGNTVVWEVWRSRMDARALFAEHPRKPKKTKRTKDEIARLVAGVPLCDRQTLESLAIATAVPKTTLWRHLKRSWLRRAVSYVKPTLTMEHKERRHCYCLMHGHRPIGKH
ncbi:hypothetical protein PC121_g3539 [Phytophthora cactorum]|nr:hypothetical protein PC120_g7315 [Phytophthora cactorum]KAG3092593.1 hypothetical protein PC121_g3539 [Phytophthora cactorum]KAG4057485.1 hypothetical protein PC123_g7512 [Phytophthora cactorum]